MSSTLGEERVNATLLLSTEDLQAKALVTNMKQYNGDSGCSTCFDTGETVRENNLHRIWPYYPDMKYRTHRSVLKCALEATRSGKAVCNGIIDIIDGCLKQYGGHTWFVGTFSSKFKVLFTNIGSSFSHGQVTAH